MKSILVILLKLYKKYFSPVFTGFFGNACRFTPTCSEYTIEALEKFGMFRGSWMAVKRISKCHPWGGFGYDPIPKSV